MVKKLKLPFHPRVESHRRERRGKLTLKDSAAMAVGGMIGGGIFSVLGVTVDLAGHLAFACFVLGGAVALMTAHSFAVLSRRAGKSGGLFIYLREAGYPKTASYAAWLLIFSYVVALAVYAFTFGHYAAHVFGLPEVAAKVFSVFILVLFLGINLRGVAASALAEDTVVFIKILVLAIIATVGVAHFSPTRLQPLDNKGLTNVIVATTSIFVAYEGFELLSYDFDDIYKPYRTLPRALYLSVAVVALIYIIVTVGSQMLVGDKLIIEQKEVAFATVGRAGLGPIGFWMATFGALLATSSAINATLFSTARQIHEVSLENELPASLGRSRRGLPVAGLFMLTVFGAAFALLPSVIELLTFGSAMFLAVFGITNYLAYWVATTVWQKLVSILGTIACLAAMCILLLQLVHHDHSTLLLITISTAVVTLAWFAFKLRQNYLHNGAV